MIRHKYNNFILAIVQW